jgi:hypothetical protein
VAALKELNKTVAHWTDGSSGLLVHSRDKDEMLRERRERYEKRLASIPMIEDAGEADSSRGGDDIADSSPDENVADDDAQ